MMTKPSCSIIIRAYNEEEHIRRLLTGITEQTIKDVQVILVDSGSTDRTLAEAGDSKVEIVNIQPHEFTFGRSLNLGIAKARAELIVIASAHVYPVYPDWLKTLLDPFSDPQVGLTYGKQRGSETTHFSEQQIFKHWYPDQSDLRQAHPFCNNANAAIRRSLWAAHPYDETLPGLEDLEWGKWAHNQGHRISYVAEAEVIHVHKESITGIFNRYRREGMAFKQIFPTENFHKRDLVRLFIQNTSHDWREAIKKKVFIKNFFKIIGFRWNQFSGTYRGYQQSGPLTWQLKQAFYYPRILNPQPKSKRDIEPIQYK
jgi:rhamnosyltransferase